MYVGKIKLNVNFFGRLKVIYVTEWCPLERIKLAAVTFSHLLSSNSPAHK